MFLFYSKTINFLIGKIKIENFKIAYANHNKNKIGVDGKNLFVDYIDYIVKMSKSEFLSKYRELISLNINSRGEYLKDNKNSDDFLTKNLQLTFRLLMSQEYSELNKIYLDYTAEKLDYIIYEDLPSDPSHLYYSNYSIIFFGLMFGSLLFLVIIFLNSSTVNKKKISLKNNL